MKTFGTSYLKFCSCELRDYKERAIWFSYLSRRQEKRYLGHQKLRDGATNLRISFNNKCVHPISETVSAQADTEINEIRTVDSDPPKAVRVRFKLQKECAFGEQFILVGNDPVLGMWEPSNGLPLNWSEDHVWIGEVDLPSNKSIHYKFVLKAKTGTIVWQTGPDRVLTTWDTDKVIAVFEDWDSPELQNIVDEEDVSANAALSPSVSNEELISSSNGSVNYVENPSISMVAENITDDWKGQDLSLNDDILSGDDNQKKEEHVREDDDDDDKVIMSGSNVIPRSTNEPRLVSDQEVPVLVPGLVPMTEEVEKVELNKPEEKRSIEIESDKIGQGLSSKAELKCGNALQYSAESNEVIMTEEKRKHVNEEHEQREDSIVQADMQWGRRTLQKFLANLGFQ